MQDDVTPTESLLRAAGLVLTVEDVGAVDVLRAQFVAMREALASVDLRAVEPMTIIMPRRVEQGNA
jgi:hypothetical protein